ncbi:hypothetical protein AGMMS49941_07450 [Deferribacterales bacterium]|nr:hypothetical protein AGMMS49941_07450 [Deferribacterales bacterium]
MQPAGAASEFSLVDGNFSTIYPKPFMDRTLVKAAFIGGSAIVVAGVTFATGGAGTTAIAAMSLSAYGGGAATGGMATAGGLATVAGIGDLALSLAVEVPLSMHSPYEKYTFIKLPLPSKTNPQVRDMFSEIEGEYASGNPKEQNITAYYKNAMKIIDGEDKTSKTYGYDMLAKSIILYNTGDYVGAGDALVIADKYFNKKGVISYVKALLALIKGEYRAADEYLLDALDDDPKAVPPYLLYAQILLDIDDVARAKSVAKHGLDRADADNYALLRIVADIDYYHQAKYNEAIEFYRLAKRNMSTDWVEAELELRIALCYRKLGDEKLAHEHYVEALNQATDAMPSKLLKRILGLQLDDEFKETINKIWNAPDA